MTPQTVNAVNLPLQNALNFPAAILQPPYFDPGRDAAANYRRDGRDDRPRDQPQLRRSGQPVRRAGTAGQLVDAAGSRALQGGRRSAGRAIRRVSAVSRSRHQRPSGARARTSPILPGSPPPTTPITCRSTASRRDDQDVLHQLRSELAQQGREESIRLQVTTDGHAPDEYRAATVRNLDPWYAAFNVTPAQKMYLPPEKRVRVW